MLPVPIHRGIPNSQRDTSDTYKVIAVVFPRIRKDMNSFYIDEDLYHNEEAARYHAAFMPTKEHVKKNKRFIEENMLVYQDHTMITCMPGEECEMVPAIGWVETVDLTDKFSDNKMLYTAMVLHLRVPRENMRTLLIKHNQTSPYALSFSIQFNPVLATEKDVMNAENYNANKVVDVEFIEVSFTLNPAFPSCRTLQCYTKSAGKKKYKVQLPASIKKIMNTDGKTLPNETVGKDAQVEGTTETVPVAEPDAPSPAPVLDASAPPAVVGSATETVPDTLSGETAVPDAAPEDTAKSVDIGDDDVARYIRENFNVEFTNFDDIEKPEVKRYCETTRRFFMDRARKGVRKQFAFISRRDKETPDFVNMYKRCQELRNRPAPSEDDISRFKHLLYMYDYRDQVDTLQYCLKKHNTYMQEKAEEAKVTETVPAELPKDPQDAMDTGPDEKSATVPPVKQVLNTDSIPIVDPLRIQAPRSKFTQKATVPIPIVKRGQSLTYNSTWRDAGVQRMPHSRQIAPSFGNDFKKKFFGSPKTAMKRSLYKQN